MVSEEKYHLINDYLRGELKGRALDSFKAELNESEELQQAVKLQASIIEGLEQAREEELKAYIQKNISGSGGLSISSTLRVALASAAAIALIAVAFIVFQNLSSSQEQEITSEDTHLPQKPKPTKSLPEKVKDTPPLIDTQTLAIETTEPNVLEEVEDDIETEEDIALEETEDLMVPAEADAEENEPALDIASTSTAGTPENPLKDELLGKNQFMVNAIVTLIEEESLEVQKPAKRVSDKAYDDTDVSEEKIQPASNSRPINVEYWKPVMNSKVYLYDGNTVKLYGIKNQTPLEFKELDNRLYVELNSKHYFLEKNSKHNRLVEVTNPTLLKVLNE
jgi:cell division septation protein DedD